MHNQINCDVYFFSTRWPLQHCAVMYFPPCLRNCPCVGLHQRQRPRSPQRTETHAAAGPQTNTSRRHRGETRLRTLGTVSVPPQRAQPPDTSRYKLCVQLDSCHFILLHCVPESCRPVKTTFPTRAWRQRTRQWPQVNT